MIRRAYCELLLREIYGGQPSDDAKITINQVNLYLNGAIATAAKLNFTENKRSDNVEYVNDAFYLSFNDRAITRDYEENFLYTIALPAIPAGIGSNLGIASVEIRKSDGSISQPVILLSAMEWTRRKTGRRIPNKILGNYEGSVLKLQTTLQLYRYTGNVKMVSGGSTDLDSTVNVPDDYMKTILAYIKEELVFEKSRPVDTTNDGKDQK